MIILQNEWLRAAISPLGAELQSLQHLTTGIEHMWSGDATFWSKHSPVLFPIVGSLKQDTYFFEGKAYHLPRHGFAREKLFSAEKINNTEAVFTLTEDEATKAVYPFRFQLRLRYILKEERSGTSLAVIEKSRDYVETRIDLARLKITEKTSDVISDLASKLILIAIASVFVLMLNVGIALWLGELLGKNYYGFFVLAGFYALVALVSYLLREKWIEEPVTNAIIKKRDSFFLLLINFLKCYRNKKRVTCEHHLGYRICT
ncbi:MAG: hypothetical protein EOO03_05160 [Chitinophagaceae bacterium]|nr:MAG: hypothetical protein EOO03_05160 [Chitinophagaceae bacterium]